MQSTSFMDCVVPPILYNVLCNVYITYIQHTCMHHDIVWLLWCFKLGQQSSVYMQQAEPSFFWFDVLCIKGDPIKDSLTPICRTSTPNTLKQLGFKWWTVTTRDVQGFIWEIDTSFWPIRSKHIMYKSTSPVALFGYHLYVHGWMHIDKHHSFIYMQVYSLVMTSWQAI